MHDNIIVLHREIENKLTSLESDSQNQNEFKNLPRLKELEKKTTDELLKILQEQNFVIDQKQLQNEIKNHTSAKSLLDYYTHLNEYKIDNIYQEHLFYLVFILLWKNLDSKKQCMELFDSLVYDGYLLSQSDKNNFDINEVEEERIIENWYQAYKLLHYFINRLEIKHFLVLKEQFEGEYELKIWFEDFFSLLLFTGEKKNIQILEEITKNILNNFEEENDELISTFRIHLALSYFHQGKPTYADELYQKWLERHLDWEIGWIAWSDAYGFKTSPLLHVLSDEARYKKSAKILLDAERQLKNNESKHNVLMRLKEIYRLWGKTEEMKSVDERLSLISLPDKGDIWNDELEEDGIESPLTSYMQKINQSFLD